MPRGERGVERADAVPLLGDEAEVHRPPAALEDRLENAVVAARVGTVDPLAVQAADARAEPHADHPEGREVDLGVAVGVGVVLFEVEVALVVEHAVEHEGRVAVGALDRAAVERGVVIGDEGVELEREVVKAGAVGPLQHLVRYGEALPVWHPLHQMQVPDLGPLGHPDHLRVLPAQSTRRPVSPRRSSSGNAVPECSGGPCTFLNDFARVNLAESGRPPGATEGSLCLKHLKRTCAPAFSQRWMPRGEFAP